MGDPEELHATQGDFGAVALIAVHGVADQVAGATARQLAALMVGARDGALLYLEAAAEQFVLPVRSLESARGNGRPESDVVWHYAERNGNGSSTYRIKQTDPVSPIDKSLRQSFRSDFQRDDWVATREAADQPKVPENFELMHFEDNRAVDPSLAFTDYLLFKAKRYETQHEAYETTRLRLGQKTVEPAQPSVVDVFELYWADLSRLSGAVPRVVAETFTLLFRLSRLGRDTVDEASRAARQRVVKLETLLKQARFKLRAAKAKRDPAAKGEVKEARDRVDQLKEEIHEEKAWPRLSKTQTALDWALACLLAPLLLQLVICSVLMVGLASAYHHEHVTATVMVGVVALGALGWIAYSVERLYARLPMYCVVAFGVWCAVRLVPPSIAVAVFTLAVVALLTVMGLRAAEARFPSTGWIGCLFLGLTLIAIVARFAYAIPSIGSASLADWLEAVLRTTELHLLLFVIWWAVIPPLMLVWLYLGRRVSACSDRARASVVTGRLGFLLSTAFLLIFGMAFWALVTEILQHSANVVAHYHPWIFDDPTLLKDANYRVEGGKFLEQRYLNSTDMFSVVAGFALALIVYLVVVFLPSVLAELKLKAGAAKSLGRWLTTGYKDLERLIGPMAGLAVAASCIIGFSLIALRFHWMPPAWWLTAVEFFGSLSHGTLARLVIGAATVFAGLSILGRLLSRYAAWVRLPLDVALDVDNYFREFPRKAIPRAKILARYVALLEHLVASGYRHIVIVAHSQGSVISADLLRYIEQHSHDTRLKTLRAQLEGRVDFVTVGCPLRQLYCARFPELYGWVTNEKVAGLYGPTLAGVGARSWTNFYTAGDYVGRWLWCDDGPHNASVQGRDVPYEASPVPPAYSVGVVQDHCLGFGAHTHYLDQNQAHLRNYLDQVIANRPPAP